MQPKPAKHAIVLAVDDNGKIVQCLQHEADDAYSPVSSVIERDGMLFLGSFEASGIARVPLAAPAR